jgi:cellulose synthase/poly-beta-1,6-N-acetylglucosamine synthase-like glycosyltransferase
VSCPTLEEKNLYLKTNKKIFYAFGVSSFIVLMIGMWLFALAHPLFLLFSIFAFMVTVYLGVSYLIGIFGKEFTPKKDLTFKPTSVDVYLPCCGEDLEIIETTYKSVCKLKANIYVLDDSGRDEIKALAEKYNFTYFRRPDPGVNKKAGNLRYAFARTTGEFIVIFDADFCPREDFIEELLPYFNDPKVGIVQTPQYFNVSDKYNWVENGAAYIQELFYRLIQVNRASYDAAICVGTNAMYRRSALEPFGGTALIDYSEDVHTGFNVIKNGGKIVYVPINLAKGRCPDSLKTFFTQQYRWAMGSITLFMSSLFWKTKLTVMQRLCYLTGMFYYIVTGISIFITPLPSMLLLIFLPEKMFWYNIIFSLPSFIFGLVVLAYWSKAPFTFASVYCRYVSYYSHLFALVDKLRGNMLPWVPTGNKNVKFSRFAFFKNLVIGWNVFVLSTVFLLVGYRIGDYTFYNFIPVMLFTLYNFVIAIVSISKEE